MDERRRAAPVEVDRALGSQLDHDLRELAHGEAVVDARAAAVAGHHVDRAHLRGLATAAIDVSDGLLGDLAHVLQRSQVGASLVLDALPVSLGLRARSRAEQLDCILAGGDDYELLFAVRPRTRRRLAAAIQHGGVPITRIGVCTADPAVLLRSADGDRPFPSGYSHFR